MQCPACNHTAPDADFGPARCCPSCGAYYDKARALRERRQAEAAQRPAPAKPKPAEPPPKPAASPLQPSAEPPPKPSAEPAFRLAADHVKVATRGLQGAQPVVVVDIQMRFWSMVVFIVKWALASIPALLILSFMAAAAASAAWTWLSDPIK